MESEMRRSGPAKKSIHVRTRPAPWVGMGIWLVIGAAGVLRVWQLTSIPGLNGDEAWYGLQAERLLTGNWTEWRTPNGMLQNVLYFFPVTLIHLVSGPSMLNLRVIALVCGLATCLLNFIFAKRVLGQSVAVISTVMLAVLPINIAYSRFGWDASQSVLMSLTVIYPILHALKADHPRPWLSLAFACWVLSVHQHPTNIMLGAFWLVAALHVYKGHLNAIAPAWRVYLPVLGIVLGAVTLGIVSQVDFLGSPWDRLRPRSLALFARNFIGLFSGDLVFEYISGPMRYAGTGFPTIRQALALACEVAVIGLLSYGCWPHRGGDQPVKTVLLRGGLIALLYFYLLAGTQGTRPQNERYCLWAVLPVILIGSVTLVDVFRRGKWFQLAGLAIASLFLANFSVNYLEHFYRTGGTGPQVFWTAEREPKFAAIELVRDSAAEGQPCLVVCDEWWTFTPLRYAFLREEQVTVIRESDLPDEAPELQGLLDGFEVAWVIVLTENERSRIVERLAPHYEVPEEAHDMATYGEGTALRCSRLQRLPADVRAASDTARVQRQGLSGHELSSVGFVFQIPFRNWQLGGAR